MKTYRLLFFSVLFSVLGCSYGISQVTTQAESGKIYRHQVGINGTLFLKQMLPFGNIDTSTLALSPYLFTYKYMPKRIGARFGIGANYNVQEQTDDANSTVKITSTNLSYDLRLGAEYQIPLTSRWLTYVGLDATLANQTFEVDRTSDFDLVTTAQKTASFGGGPVLGMQFHINQRLLLFTETAWYFSSGTVSDEETHASNPEFNLKTETKFSDLSFTLPTSIYLAIKL